ncbi:MAG TPA: aminotransferase class I/II-fold pyridoxal phosphate-dependent enzyme [Bryobacteraceae bacterium]|nr:aminotransferase class I/II-fold pyridoxal phosphate-dependent enzyme [Bryobacteraceae bacterium]
MADTKSLLRPPTEVLTRGFDPRLSLGSARPAVFRSSTYVFSSPEAAERAFDIMAGRASPEPGEHIDLVYSRFNHPNAEIFEDQIVPLEAGAQAALVFNSGMSAIMTALFAFLRPGDTIVYTVPIYGGTQKLIENFLSSWGVNFIAAHAGKTEAMEDAIRAAKNLRVVLIETPANPTIIMTDIRRSVDAAATLAAAHNEKPVVMVDNTMLGPAFQHPLELGADLVLYSATKYLSGFSDLIGGVALARDRTLIQKMRSLRGLFGNILQPDECWMLDHRLPTVGLRMNRQSKNAQRIAERLAHHPKVKQLLYPTLADDPEQKRIYHAQCDFPGAMFSIDLRGGKRAAFEFLRHLRLARNAVSLGGVETLVCHPKTTTHSGFTEEQFAQAGVTDGLVRISIGIEDWRDLLADFEQALDAA